MSKKILILDDEPDILEMFKRKLERAGYVVAAAKNGQEGLNAARTQLFDLIVTDVVMPVMDGFQFFKEIKKMRDYIHVPVIVMSAHGGMEDTFRAFGVAEFFVKPVDSDVVLKAIERLAVPSSQKAARRNVILLGSDMETMRSMVQLLNDHGHKAVAARDEIDFFDQALAIVPDIVLIDVLLPKLMAHELIKAMRCFSRFSNLTILTYTHFTEKELTNVNAVEQLKDAKNQCTIAGATAYIGRFTKVTFMESMEKY